MKEKPNQPEEREIMAKFIIKDVAKFIANSGDLQDYQLYMAIMESNERAEILQEPTQGCPFVVVCDNKPNDLPLFGIEWIEEMLQ